MGETGFGVFVGFGLSRQMAWNANFFELLIAYLIFVFLNQFHHW